MIQLTEVFCLLFSDKEGSVASDHNKRLIQLSVIQLSGGHCMSNHVDFKQSVKILVFRAMQTFCSLTLPCMGSIL